MTLFRSRMAALLAALCGGVMPAHAPAAGPTTPPAIAAWTFASHKPLMQAVPPVPRDAGERVVDPDGRALATQRTGELAPSDLTPETVDAQAWHVTPAPATGLELVLAPADGRVSQAVRRYAERHGWQLAWEIERDFPIEYPATFRGDFLGIVEQIVRSLQSTDAPIRVKVYSANRVLRVVHATQ